MSTIAIPPLPTLTPPAPPVPTADDLYETINGVRREISPMGALAGAIASVLSQILGPFTRSHKLGLTVAEVLFRLREAPKLELRPDLAFVAYDRLSDPVLPPEDPAAWAVTPSLAVEVVSPTNTADEVLDKINHYFTNGVALVWVIYPRQRLVYVYQSPLQPQVLDEQGFLDGGAVIPGFQLKVGDLFAALVKP